MNGKQAFDWQSSLLETYNEFSSQAIDYTPHILGAIVLFATGFIIAHILRMITYKVIRSLDTIFQQAAKIDGARQERIRRSYAVIISKIVFWTVIIFFAAATGNMLGWKMFSGWMSSVISYLPNLITGLLIILAGFLFANGARTAVISTASSSGIQQGEILSRIAQIVIIFTTLVIGVEQIGINVDFLTNVFIVVIGVLLAGGALAFGLGAKTLVANIIGAQYLRKHCRIGEQMTIGDVEGVLVEVTQTSIVLDTDYGRSIVPAKHFQDTVSNFKSEISEVDIKIKTPKKKSKK
ncbi:mechanosensitive ion channel [Rickettsiales bacterium]|nr:mechanosensitive ion channel [Rickettsiales bacterium]